MSTSGTTLAPDEAALRRDFESAAFLIGEAEGRWQLVAPGIQFPNAFFGVSAAARPASPPMFHFCVNAAGYPSRPPTTRLWDISTGGALATSKHPKGSGNVAIVFRPDWPPEAPGSCLYHPMDRRPLTDHPDWPNTYAREVWTPRRTIVDLLEVIYELLNSANYRDV